MSTNADHLARHVRERRRDLALSQLEVWQAGGPSNTTLTAIENGLAKSLQNATAKKLDRGLQWRPGSARRVWDGGEPMPQEASTVDDLAAKVEASNLAPETKALILERLAELPTPHPPSDSRESNRGA